MHDIQIEQEILDKRLTAPRVTLAEVQANIVGETYTLLPNGRSTVCQLALISGHTVVGFSSCVSIENYNEELGNKIARENAVREIWPLMGYELSCRLQYQGVR
jgi:hypothetical protein